MVLSINWYETSNLFDKLHDVKYYFKKLSLYDGQTLKIKPLSQFIYDDFSILKFYIWDKNHSVDQQWYKSLKYCY